MGHDWGSVVVQMYASQFPHTVGKLILLDVAMAGLEQKLDKETLIKAAYMMYLSICFIVSRLSTILALIMVKLYPWSLIGPYPYEVSVVQVYVCTGVCCSTNLLYIIHVPHYIPCVHRRKFHTWMTISRFT